LPKIGIFSFVGQIKALRRGSMGRKVLGRGIEALIPQKAEGEIEEIEISKIRRNPNQPRQQLDPEKLKELAASIEQRGVLQPIMVRRVGEEYELVVGERRFQAAKTLGWEKIPAILKHLSDDEILQISLIENLQREDLNPIEEAEAYESLIKKLKLSQEEVAKQVGRDRTSITNALRLLKLPKEVKDLLVAGKISAGHARALLGLASEKETIRVSRLIVAKGLSVRQTENLVKRLKEPPKATQPKDPIIEVCEQELMDFLGTKVRIRHGKRRGKIEIEYYSVEDLERILERIRG
jgi:ParB family chromosome partitioning protein